MHSLQERTIEREGQSDREKQRYEVVVGRIYQKAPDSSTI